MPLFDHLTGVRKVAQVMTGVIIGSFSSRVGVLIPRHERLIPFPRQSEKRNKLRFTNIDRFMAFKA